MARAHPSRGRKGKSSKNKKKDVKRGRHDIGPSERVSSASAADSRDASSAGSREETPEMDGKVKEEFMEQQLDQGVTGAVEVEEDEREMTAVDDRLFVDAEVQDDSPREPAAEAITVGSPASPIDLVSSDDGRSMASSPPARTRRIKRRKRSIESDDDDDPVQQTTLNEYQASSETSNIIRPLRSKVRRGSMSDTDDSDNSDIASMRETKERIRNSRLRRFGDPLQHTHLSNQSLRSYSSDSQSRSPTPPMSLFYPASPSTTPAPLSRLGVRRRITPRLISVPTVTPDCIVASTDCDTTTTRRSASMGNAIRRLQQLQQTRLKRDYRRRTGREMDSDPSAAGESDAGSNSDFLVDDEKSSADTSDGSHRQDTESESDNGTEEEESLWDSEDKDDLSDGYDSDAEYSGFSIAGSDAEAEAEAEDKYVKRRARVPSKRLYGPGKVLLQPLRGLEDLVLTPITIDPLPAHLMSEALMDEGFASDSDQEVGRDDDDDEDEDEDGNYHPAPDAGSSAHNSHLGQAAEDSGGEDNDDDRDGAGISTARTVPTGHGRFAGGGDAAGGKQCQADERAKRKYRAQLDRLAFRIMLIICTTWYRNTPENSHAALQFLKGEPFAEAWRYLMGKMRYAAGHLERSLWPGLRGEYKGYASYTSDGVSLSEYCTGCERDHQDRCRSFTDIVMEGGYDDITLCPVRKPRRNAHHALGTDCRTSFAEAFSMYHAVYQAVTQLYKDSFDPYRIKLGIRRILHQEVVNIDELYQFFQRQGTDEKMMKSLHRKYALVKHRRMDMWRQTQNRAILQRDQTEALAQRFSHREVPKGGAWRVRGHLVGGVYHGEAGLEE